MKKRPAHPAGKRRTREHVIADMSRVHVEAIAIDAGFTADYVRADYGYDLEVTTFDENGYVEPDRFLIQLKASDTIEQGATAEEWAFDLDIRDYNLWLREPSPVFLIRYDASSRAAYWLYVQRYFEENPFRRPAATAKTVRVRIPKINRVDVAFMAFARREKARILDQRAGAIHHAE